MGYNQWVTMTVKSINIIAVKNINVRSGQLYGENVDTEVSADSIYSQKTVGGSTILIQACGTDDPNVGCEGEFDIHDVGGGGQGVKIGHVYWHCPLQGLDMNNTLKITKNDEDYIILSSGENLGEGPLGNISIEVTNKGIF